MSLKTDCESILWGLNNYDISETKKEAIRKICEKQIPKKVSKEVVDEQEASGFSETCPSCGIFVYDEYCCNCGQHLDWE